MKKVFEVKGRNDSSFDYQEKLETGRKSGLVAIHVKPGGDKSRWTSTEDFKAADGSTYFVYWHPGVPYYDSVSVPSAKNILPFTDVYGEDDFVVLPPHNKGKWIDQPNTVTHLSDNEICLIAKDPKFEITNPPEVLLEAAADQFILKLLGEIPPNGKESVEALWGKFQQWYATYDGTPIGNMAPSIHKVVPYDETRLREFFNERLGFKDAVEIWMAPYTLSDGTSMYFLTSVYESTVKNSAEILQATDNRNGKGPSHAVRLVDMVLNNPEVTLFKDEYSVAHVRIPIGNHAEVWPCNSSSFTRWIGGEYYRLTKGKNVAGRENVKDAVNLLEGRAINEGEDHRLFNRVAQTPDAIWYDLGDAEWRAVKTTESGWDIVRDVPMIFRRFSHLDTQVDPVRGGSVQDVLPFVNITNPELQILFLVHLVASFIPGFPHPALYVHGPQGSAKSTAGRIDRKLIDPSKIEVLSLTSHEGDLEQQLGQHYFWVCDNVSDISNRVADLFCRAITGSGFSKRGLYTNDEAFIRQIMANISINGINLASNRADLLERCLLLKLERMKVRKDEHKLMSDFELARPKILGAIFSAVSKAIAIRPSVKVDELPRMADFALWGCSIAEALGIGQEAFLDAYFHNISSQSEEVVNDNVVATLLISLMNEEYDLWEGMPAQLFKRLKEIALTEMIVDKKFPESPSSLMREINRVKTALEEMGLHIVSHSDRSVIISRTKADSVTDNICG